MQQKRRKIRYGKYIFRWIMLILIIGLLILSSVCGVKLLHFYRAVNGKIPAEKPDASEFPVRGIDVSRYQGEIDWNILSQEEHVQFAFIKATEGSTYQDDLFSHNWENAREAGVFVGAYHFFRFESDGQEQADNFIATVPKAENMLPPVIDIEWHESDAALDEKWIQEQISEMIAALEDYYGMKPILYTNPSGYIDYFLGHYWGYDIWMSNPYCDPVVNWTFWQYSFEGDLNGFPQENIPVDLNVYNGSRKKFLKTFSLSERKD